MTVKFGLSILSHCTWYLCRPRRPDDQLGLVLQQKTILSDEISLRLQFGNDLITEVKIDSPITFTDQFLEMSLVYSPDPNFDFGKTGQFHFMGFGERRGDLILGENHWKHGVWNRDLPPTVGTNLYGDQPIWIAQNPFRNQAIGTVWWNSNAKSFEILPLADHKTRLTLRQLFILKTVIITAESVLIGCLQ